MGGIVFLFFVFLSFFRDEEDEEQVGSDSEYIKKPLMAAAAAARRSAGDCYGRATDGRTDRRTDRQDDSSIDQCRALLRINKQSDFGRLSPAPRLGIVETERKERRGEGDRTCLRATFRRKNRHDPDPERVGATKQSQVEEE